MNHQPITDQQVADLPVHGGRAHLLEDIMRSPVDRPSSAGRLVPLHMVARPRRHRRAAVASAAAGAAVVATIGGVAAWRAPGETATRPGGESRFADSPGTTAQSRTITRLSLRHSSGVPGAPRLRVTVTPAAPPTHDELAHPASEVPGGAYVALGRAGWFVTSVYDGAGGSDLVYRRGGAMLELTTYPAGEYASYVADRHGDAGVSKDLTLMGQPARLWTYGSDDHTVIRAVEGDRFLEVRGTCLTEQAFRTALADLVQTDEAGYAASLPDGVVTPYNRDTAVHHLLEGVATPPGFTGADVRIQGFNDGYQSAAQVAGSVGCAWLDVWRTGSAADRHDVVSAFEGSRHWPLLVDIRHQGAYSQVFWSVAGRLRAGSDDKGGHLDIDTLQAGLC